MTTKDNSANRRVAPHSPGDLFNILRALESARGLLTVAEVAVLLRKSVSVIYRMAEHDRIPCFRIGGEWRFDPSALALWLTKKDPTLAVTARQQARAA
jgi:excisionase family DNA binding protein